VLAIGVVVLVVIGVAVVVLVVIGVVVYGRVRRVLARGGSRRRIGVVRH